MATSGNATTGLFGGNSLQIRLLWQTISQDTSGNSSKVRLTLQFIVSNNVGSYSIRNPAPWNLKLNGAIKASGNFYGHPGIGTTTTVGTVDVTVPHNADGTCSFSASANFTYTTSGTVASASLNGTLNTIPRASTPTVSGTLYMGSPITINTNRLASSFTHTLKYSFNGHSGTIATGVGASYTWTPAIATFAPWCTDALSKTCTITCNTYSGSKLVGTKTTSFALKVPGSVVPTLTSSTITDVNGFFNTYGAYVSGNSHIKVAVVAQGAYGSAVNGYSAAIGVYSSNYQSSSTIDTGIIYAGAGNTTVNIAARDTRGREIKGTRAITVCSYQAPSISGSAKRTNSAGVEDDEALTLRIHVSGSVHNVNNKGINAGTVKIYIKDSETADYPDSPDYNANKGQSWSFDWEKTVSRNDVGYDIKLEVIDSLGVDVQTYISVGYAQPIMDFRTGGKGVAIGHIANRDGFTVGYNTVFDAEVQFDRNMAGIRENGNVVGESKIIELAVADVAYNSDSSWGFIRVRGQIGGWTGSSLGPIDVYIPTREYSTGNVYVAIRSPHINTGNCTIKATVDSNNKVHVYLVCGGYYLYDVFVNCMQATVVNREVSAMEEANEGLTWTL